MDNLQIIYLSMSRWVPIGYLRITHTGQAIFKIIWLSAGRVESFMGNPLRGLPVDTYTGRIISA